jgi:hypothetical protein
LSLTAQGNIRYRLVAPAHPAHATFVHPCTAAAPAHPARAAFVHPCTAAAPAHPARAAFVHPCTAKTPYRDGTTEVVFDPLDLMARLAALVPTLRVNLTRYHGVFAPNRLTVLCAD